MTINNVINTLPYNANSAVRWNKRNIAKINKLVVHQSLGTKTVVNTNAYCISKEDHTAPGVGLPHIPYHFFIEQDGKVYQCNNYDDWTWQVVGHNQVSLGICLGGFFNYETTICRDGVPTKAQLDSLRELLDHLMKMFKLGKKNVYMHCELQKKPSCPGNGAKEFMTKFRNEANQ